MRGGGVMRINSYFFISDTLILVSILATTIGLSVTACVTSVCHKWNHVILIPPTSQDK